MKKLVVTIHVLLFGIVGATGAYLMVSLSGTSRPAKDQISLSITPGETFRYQVTVYDRNTKSSSQNAVKDRYEIKETYQTLTRERCERIFRQNLKLRDNRLQNLEEGAWSKWLEKKKSLPPNSRAFEHTIDGKHPRSHLVVETETSIDYYRFELAPPSSSVLKKVRTLPRILRTGDSWETKHLTGCLRPDLSTKVSGWKLLNTEGMKKSWAMEVKTTPASTDRLGDIKYFRNNKMVQRIRKSQGNIWVITLKS